MWGSILAASSQLQKSLIAWFQAKVQAVSMHWRMWRVDSSTKRHTGQQGESHFSRETFYRQPPNSPKQTLRPTCGKWEGTNGGLSQGGTNPPGELPWWSADLSGPRRGLWFGSWGGEEGRAGQGLEETGKLEMVSVHRSPRRGDLPWLPPPTVNFQKLWQRKSNQYTVVQSPVSSPFCSNCVNDNPSVTFGLLPPAYMTWISWPTLPMWTLMIHLNYSHPDGHLTFVPVFMNQDLLPASAQGP